MIKNPRMKYQPLATVDLPKRNWPNRIISSPPIWLSTDLRDGNQALVEPMGVEKKIELFKLLVKIGFKEIEVAFPSASETDFNFVRRLIDDGLVPDDVTIGVITQARDHLIETTVESLIGAKKAIVHIYNPIAPTFRKVVYGKSKAEIIELSTKSTALLKSLTKRYSETDWCFQYSPETFSMAELSFSKEVCDSVIDVWKPSVNHKLIINLPSTVECSTPNIFADQIEWMSNNINSRDSVILSVHPHNDRGTAVAAAELAVLAGADRVEGCLFGNGERTGNVDLLTLALNLYTQGVDPKLDFSDLDEIQRCAEYCTQIPVHPRHPYSGELVFTAFSGSHQDAIKKGFACHKDGEYWDIPYLPIDPKDLGRGYDAVVRLNGQSGKGGVSYILEKCFGIELPRKMQIELSGVVQKRLGEQNKEILPEQVFEAFMAEFINRSEPYVYVAHQESEEIGGNGATKVEVVLRGGNSEMCYSGFGNGPLDAAVNALSEDIDIVKFSEQSIGSGSNSEAVCFLEIRYKSKKAVFGVGKDTSIVTASLKALISGINRLEAKYGVSVCKTELFQCET